MKSPAENPKATDMADDDLKDEVFLGFNDEAVLSVCNLAQSARQQMYAGLQNHAFAMRQRCSLSPPKNIEIETRILGSWPSLL